MSERASQTVAEDLRRMVITGELAAGTLLSEARLSELLGCSRTPLREALQQLSHQYLVTIPPRRGILIPELSIVDLQQLFEALLVMGDGWIALAAERIDDRQLRQMKDIVTQQEQWNKEAGFYDLVEWDCQFHILIADATRNRYFGDSARSLHSALARFTYAAYEAAGGASASIAEHGKMVEALARRDGELAKQRQREHTTGGRQRILQILGLGAQSAPS